MPTQQVRLIRRLAERMNGIDVSKLKVGDVLELSVQDATMMIEEGWAERVSEPDTDEQMVET